MANRITVEKHDTVEGLRKKLRQASDEAEKIRLKAIIAAKQGKKRYEIVEQLMVDAKSVTTWLARYNAGGTNTLKTNKGGRPKGNPKWDSAHFEKLTKQIDKGGYWSIPRMQEWLSEHCKVNIPEQTVWYRMDQLHYSYKGARPHPVQGDREKQETFKKGALLRSWSH
ncbi:MAG TPA: winged helix-turn-helix domain-containing protein [Candidatus Paceibacterota bacterium]